MPLLPLTIQTIDQTLWPTLELIKQYLTIEATKRLSIALDPLVDPSIINPEEAYSSD